MPGLIPAVGETPLTLAGTNLTLVMVVAVIAVVALIMGVVFRQQVLAADPGTAKMQEIGQAVEEGAHAYLARQFKTLSVFVVIVFFLLMALPADTAGIRFGRSGHLYVALAVPSEISVLGPQGNELARHVGQRRLGGPELVEAGGRGSDDALPSLGPGAWRVALPAVVTHPAQPTSTDVGRRPASGVRRRPVWSTARIATAPAKQAIVYQPLPTGVPSLVVPFSAPRKAGRADSHITAIASR